MRKERHTPPELHPPPAARGSLRAPPPARPGPAHLQPPAPSPRGLSGTARRGPSATRLGNRVREKGKKKISTENRIPVRRLMANLPRPTRQWRLGSARRGGAAAPRPPRRARRHGDPAVPPGGPRRPAQMCHRWRDRWGHAEPLPTEPPARGCPGPPTPRIRDVIPFHCHPGTSLTPAGPKSASPTSFLQRGNSWQTQESKPFKEAASCMDSHPSRPGVVGCNCPKATRILMDTNMSEPHSGR